MASQTNISALFPYHSSAKALDVTIPHLSVMLSCFHQECASQKSCFGTLQDLDGYRNNLSHRDINDVKIYLQEKNTMETRTVMNRCEVTMTYTIDHVPIHYAIY